MLGFVDMQKKEPHLERGDGYLFHRKTKLVIINSCAMPRQARQASGTGIYHVMMRGINHQNIFEEQEDYYQFLNTLDFPVLVYGGSFVYGMGVEYGHEPLPAQYLGGSR